MLSPNDQLTGLAWGPFIADALAMPVHWYYDRTALLQDYGTVRSYLPPKQHHPGSILWRSHYTPLNERGDILHDQAPYWGQHGVHYHQFLRAGQNTLNLQLAKVLLDSLLACKGYDANDYLQRYLHFMLTPGQHRDTYIEECHRRFFTAYARGTAPHKCAANDIHIGGLAHVGLLCAFFAGDLPATQQAVRTHVALTHRAPEVLTAADALVKMISDVINGTPLREAILTHGTTWFSKRKAELWSREPDHIVIGRRVSPACYINEAFPASLYLAWKYASDFESGLIANTNVGGDNCHRGTVVGALLGVATGATAIPSHFIEDLDQSPQLTTQINALLEQRSPSTPCLA